MKELIEKLMSNQIRYEEIRNKNPYDLELILISLECRGYKTLSFVDKNVLKAIKEVLEENYALDLCEQNYDSVITCIREKGKLIEKKLEIKYDL